MQKRTLILPVVALVLGVGIGASGQQPAAKAATTAVAPSPKTVEVEVEVVPAACTEAIEAARKVSRGIAVFTEGASIYPPLVGRAWEAGLTSSLSEGEAILGEMSEANEQFDMANAIVAPAVAEFNVAASDCQ